MKQSVTVRIDKSLLDEIDLLAEQTGKTRTMIIQERLKKSSSLDEIDNDLIARIAYLSEKLDMAPISVVNNVIREGIVGYERAMDMVSSPLGDALSVFAKPFLNEEEKRNLEKRKKSVKKFNEDPKNKGKKPKLDN